MIVKELIEKLKKLNQDATVYYPEDEDFHAMDFDFVTEIKYREDDVGIFNHIVVVIGDKPNEVPFSHMNRWGVLSR